MCAPNQVTLLEISFLNPVTMATATIMTVNPRAIPNVAMAMIEREKLRFPFLLPIIRRTMKSSVFNESGFCQTNVVIFCLFLNDDENPDFLPPDPLWFNGIL